MTFIDLKRRRARYQDAMSLAEPPRIVYPLDHPARRHGAVEWLPFFVGLLVGAIITSVCFVAVAMWSTP
jgi:hypothetical protein